jgi:hypothetical protein
LQFLGNQTFVSRGLLVGGGSVSGLLGQDLVGDVLNASSQLHGMAFGVANKFADGIEGPLCSLDRMGTHFEIDDLAVCRRDQSSPYPLDIVGMYPAEDFSDATVMQLLLGELDLAEELS